MLKIDKSFRVFRTWHVQFLFRGRITKPGPRVVDYTKNKVEGQDLITRAIKAMRSGDLPVIGGHSTKDEKGNITFHAKTIRMKPKVRAPNKGGK